MVDYHRTEDGDMKSDLRNLSTHDTYSVAKIRPDSKAESAHNCISSSGPIFTPSQSRLVGKALNSQKFALQFKSCKYTMNMDHLCEFKFV